MWHFLPLEALSVGERSAVISVTNARTSQLCPFGELSSSRVAASAILIHHSVRIARFKRQDASTLA